ncbi:2Fe-2S iron-sulfur cluster-binding protein [Natronobacterium gregoryi]|uniref:Ferredoxin n=2 Tax=Natronobacterium gregoryi TaxID=44930 RepID=L0AG67_NATGS|nr:2Fe-2S iron-sulfur cluster-binding protein [Natronobacterium gregoryi]AFZ72923.1 ferredoxin [Natronobacterium gregoryi SP2]PLK21934.1 ferredoxin [Natronobacterium gregoryi SP2]SFI67390.1 ferredoxin [Natronobacterium gregoryi]
MTQYDVTLEWPDDGTDTVAVSPTETVLEVALREGIRLPYDCREGTCITCVGRVLAAGGDETPGAEEAVDAADAFDYRRQPKALTEDERANGYVLLCIAVPRADCRVAVGPMVRSEVGDSPWS